MKMKVKTMPIENITLEFEDGVTRSIKFCNYAFAILDEEFEEGSIKILVNAIMKPYKFGAMLLYGGMKSIDNNITLKEAEEITTKLPYESIKTIIEKALKVFSAEKGDGKKLTKEQEKMISQMMMQMIKA
ncbi:hypothetical protein [Inediibacterium massiliense]|uniref:hypothetical protein n=1 Tax=Inediibacterium massiliense TaxID=1658111 RepID=UPI0006B5EBD5|nr:hypothetical protein [Inediibacterium massiliense]